jgi:cbb3-type cytochrome oxidase subunit 3
MGDRRTLEVLIGMLLIFFAVALLAYFDSTRQVKIFEMGLPDLMENTLVIFFSLFSIGVVVYEIVKTKVRAVA